MSLSQQANILLMQQHINCFCVLPILARISSKFVSLTVETAVVVSAAVDVANIVAIAGVAACALWTLQYPIFNARSSRH